MKDLFQQRHLRGLLTLVTIWSIGAILVEVAWRAQAQENDARALWEEAWKSLEGKLQGAKLIVPLGDMPPPEETGEDPEVRLSALAGVIGGTVVREDHIVTLRCPRQYGEQIPGSALSGAVHELLLQLPEQQLNALLEGQVVPEQAWPPQVATAAHRIFAGDFSPREAKVNVRSRGDLSLWLAKMHGRPPTPEEVLQMEAALNKEKRRLEVLQRMDRLIGLSLQFNPLIQVFLPGKEKYAVFIPLCPPWLNKGSGGWRFNEKGFLEPVPISEEEIDRLFNQMLEELMFEESNASR